MKVSLTGCLIIDPYLERVGLSRVSHLRDRWQPMCVVVIGSQQFLLWHITLINYW